MTRYASTPTDRIDTTHTHVAVRGNSADTLQTTAAAAHVKREFPGAVILAVYRSHERDRTGAPVFVVEWADPEDQV